MTANGPALSLEDQIDLWRSYLRRRQTIHPVDIDELEDHLREQIDVLVDADLSTDEAFLVAVKRIGSLDALSREFAREHADRLWKQLVVAGPESTTAAGLRRTDAVVAIGFAIVAAIAIKLPSLFGLDLDGDAGFYARNASLFVLPFLTMYFVWKRRMALHMARWLVLPFIAAGIFANVYSFVSGGASESLTALHLPIALWLAVGIAYAGGRWNEVSGRMDFIRFSGELFIYYVLIALGGGVLMGVMAVIFQAIGIDIERFFESWMLPCGAVGAVLVASWLVEAKQSVIENMAPVLTRLFTPMFAAMLLAFLGALVWTGRGIAIERDALIVFDLLLIVVLGLLLYSISARDQHAAAGPFDLLQIILVVSALLANAVALWAIASRINDFGFTPNRTAALGVNVLLLVNLAWSAVLYVQFLRGRGTFASLERWQTRYIPVYALWAATVVVVFPPLFDYI
ncbi:MAG: permease prefix domain 1-containing protein [Thermomicrobiales bacterium]|nr:permease prefix domain 1-containing protein [Thermomicrobiales bacterium]